jgi:hypothetical protein
MKRLSRFMEHFWLAVAIATTLWALYVLVTEGWGEGRKWIWFPLVAIGMFGYRKFMRGKMEQWEREGRL